MGLDIPETEVLSLPPPTDKHHMGRLIDTGTEPLPSLRAYKVDVHSTQQEEIREFAKGPEILNSNIANIELERCTH